MGRLKIFIGETKEEAGKIAADFFEELISEKPDCLIGLATGSTPLYLYKELAEREKKGRIDFKNVKTANLDEYKGLSAAHPQSYRKFMQDNLFNHISVKYENTIVPDGTATDVEAMCKAYEEKIKEWGGIDLQLLGIGHDGHIGFNEPDDYFPAETHEVKLNEITIEANKRFFSSIDDVPKYAVTMGIGTIMAAKKIVMVVTGRDKREILKKAFEGDVTPKVPASILQFHNDVILVMDKEASYL